MAGSFADPCAKRLKQCGENDGGCVPPPRTSSGKQLKGRCRETCRHRGWCLRSVNCRSNHVHVVAFGAGDTRPKKIRTDLKAWATRRLKSAIRRPSLTLRVTTQSFVRTGAAETWKLIRSLVRRIPASRTAILYVDGKPGPTTGTVPQILSISEYENDSQRTCHRWSVFGTCIPSANDFGRPNVPIRMTLAGYDFS